MCQKAAAVSSSNWVTWSSPARCGSPARPPRRHGTTASCEAFRIHVPARRPARARSRTRDEVTGMRRSEGRGARGSQRSSWWSRTCRWSRARAPPRTERSGEPSTVIILRIRSRPKRIPKSSSERSWPSAALLTGVGAPAVRVDCCLAFIAGCGARSQLALPAWAARRGSSPGSAGACDRRACAQSLASPVSSRGEPGEVEFAQQPARSSLRSLGVSLARARLWIRPADRAARERS